MRSQNRLSHLALTAALLLALVAPEWAAVWAHGIDAALDESHHHHTHDGHTGDWVVDLSDHMAHEDAQFERVGWRLRAPCGLCVAQAHSNPMVLGIDVRGVVPDRGRHLQSADSASVSRGFRDFSQPRAPPCA